MRIDYDQIVRTLAIDGERKIASFQITSAIAAGLFVPSTAAVPAHFVLAGPTGGAPAIMAPRLLVPSDIPFAVSVDADNIFTGDNIFEGVTSLAGIKLKTRLVTGEDNFTTLDFSLLARATSESFNVFLPPATGEGQVFRLKKIDATENIVTLRAVGEDLIDDADRVALFDQWSLIEVQDALPGYWDNRTPPSDALVPLDPPPPTPTNQREIIELLQSYNLCA